MMAFRDQKGSYMTITKEKDGNTLTVSLQGRLDTTTAPELEEQLRAELPGISMLVFDLTGLTYISSAGLRVLLSSQKIMNRQGEMAVRGANEDIMGIFEITGFTDILNIEK